MAKISVVKIRLDQFVLITDIIPLMSLPLGVMLLQKVHEDVGLYKKTGYLVNVYAYH